MCLWLELWSFSGILLMFFNFPRSISSLNVCSSIKIKKGEINSRISKLIVGTALKTITIWIFTLLCLCAGAMQHLLEFETERQRHNLPMMAAIDLMKRLYSTNTAPVVLLRTFGLQATNMLPTLKVSSLSFIYFYFFFYECTSHWTWPSRR